jgi:hypothetical protein
MPQRMMRERVSNGFSPVAELCAMLSDFGLTGNILPL